MASEQADLNVVAHNYLGIDAVGIADFLVKIRGVYKFSSLALVSLMRFQPVMNLLASPEKDIMR